MAAFTIISSHHREIMDTDKLDNPHFVSAVYVKRMRLSDQVQGSPDKLAKRVRKFLTLNPEFADGANTRHWAAINDMRQRFPVIARPTRQSPCLPFESGRNALPGMEAFAAMVRS